MNPEHNNEPNNDTILPEDIASQSPIDETIQDVSSGVNYSTVIPPATPRHETTESPLIRTEKSVDATDSTKLPSEATIDYSTIDSPTVEGAPDDHVLDEYATIEEEGPGDQEKTKLESKVDETDSMVPASLRHKDSAPNQESATIIESTAVSFANGHSNVTINDATIDVANEDHQHAGRLELDRTLADATDQTVDLDGEPPSEDASITIIQRGTQKPVSTKAPTVRVSSIMSSVHTEVTINPRDLSEQDASEWNKAVGEKERTKTTPAIERTYSDEAFNCLRTCRVAESSPMKTDPLDYELLKRLGQGGMGDVYEARQASLDRKLAIKRMRPLEEAKRAQLAKAGKLEEAEESRRQQFLYEAIITSDLDHPNIVPIHDAAVSSEGDLFYTMKRVQGDAWSDRIKLLSRDENIDILLKVCDAIAFAHSRGVIHRDIKPHNVMLAKYGVVLVMDWGLALPNASDDRPRSVTATSGLGGTPAFMAPEMATGPLSKIGPESDIYLLGAALFLIITGTAPHIGKNVTDCMNAVRTNKIREAPPNTPTELLNIALKAMATLPKDRYSSVEALQQAILDYRRHEQSLLLTTRSFSELAEAKQSRSYASFSRASFGFEEAIESWPGNDQARRGLAEVSLAHGQTAYENGDYDLGLSLLSADNPEHSETIQRLKDGVREREARVTRLALLRKVAMAMLAFILIGGSAALYKINQEKNNALEARDAESIAKLDAERNAAAAVAAQIEEAKERKRAEENEKAALLAKEEATKARDAESDAKQEAQSERDRAFEQEKLAQYEAYVSKVGLTKARLDNNEADSARALLENLKDSGAEPNWEWRWLWHQANESKDAFKAERSIIDQSMDASGTRGVFALADGSVRSVSHLQDGSISTEKVESLGDVMATCVAVSVDGAWMAAGTRGGDIVVSQNGNAPIQFARAHQKEVSDLVFSPNGWLVSTSLDRTARVWNIRSQEELTKADACWHLLPVKRVAVANTNDSLLMATVVADETDGEVVVWQLARGNRFEMKEIGRFSGHESPVSAVAFTDNGQLIASGDLKGNVFVWSPRSLSSVNYEQSVDSAIKGLNKEKGPRDGKQENQLVAQSKIRFARFVDESEARRLVTTLGAATSPQAHTDSIRSIRFSDDGSVMLTGSDDYSLKLWQTSSRRRLQTFKGHGGWVIDADFVGPDNRFIVSSSNDKTVRSWDRKTYVGAMVHQSVVDLADKLKDRVRQPHDQEIAAARFSPTGRHLLTASGDRTAQVLAIDDTSLQFQEVAAFDDELLDEGTAYVAMSMELDRRNGRLFVGSADATIRIWDLERGVEIGGIRGTGLNSTFALSSDGQWLLTGSSDPELKAILWRISGTGKVTIKKIWELGEHEDAVTAMAISEDNQRLFTGDRSGLGIVWDAKIGKPIGKRIDLLRGFRINAAAFAGNGSELLVAADDQQLSRITVASGERTAKLNHDGFVTKLAVSLDGQRALTISELLSSNEFQTSAIVWDLKNGKPRLLDKTSHPVAANATERNRARITSGKFGIGGQDIVITHAATAKRPALVKLWKDASVRDAAEVFELPQSLENTEAIIPLGSSTLLTMNRNGAFRWDTLTGKLEKSYRQNAQLTSADFTMDEKYVVTASRSIKIWEVDSGKALAKLELPHHGPVRSVDCEPVATSEGRYRFASGGDDGAVRVWEWDPESNQIKMLQEFLSELPDGTINRVSYTPDAEAIVAAGSQMRLHDLGGGASVQFQAPGSNESGYLSVACSRDGQWLAAGGNGEEIYVWSRPQPERPQSVLVGHEEQVNDVVILGTGKSMRVFTASSDDTARVWDPRLDATSTETKEARELLTFRRHETDVTAIDITEDGRLLMTAGRDGTVVLWPAD